MWSKLLWSNDKLTLALGTPEYSGRVHGKGKHYTHPQFFHSVGDRAMKSTSSV